MFQVDSGVTASLSGLTITGGSTTGSGGGLYNDGGIVTLTDCTISGNSAGGNGGGIANTGTLTVSGNTSLTSNSASIGGAMYNAGNVTVTTSGVSLSGTLTNAGSIVVDSGVTVYQGDPSSGASIINQAGATFDLQGTADLSSEYYADDTVFVAGTFTNAGTLEKSTGTGTATLGYALSNTGAVEVESSTFYESGSFSNAGGITVSGGSTLTVSGPLAQSGGSTILAGGTLTSTTSTVTLTGGLLGGTGTVNGNVSNTSCSISPGATGSAGKLTIQGTYTQGAGGSPQSRDRRKRGRGGVRPARRHGDRLAGRDDQYLHHQWIRPDRWAARFRC